MITIYTDGSCLGNPGPGGWAAIIVHQGKNYIIKGHDTDTTNNRMEMQAVIAALHWIEKEHPKAKIDLHSDSNLIVQTMNQGWKRKANLDLWELIDQKSQGLNINWHWVKAHHKDKLNNEVDALAFSEAQKVKKGK